MSQVLSAVGFCLLMLVCSYPASAFAERADVLWPIGADCGEMPDDDVDEATVEVCALANGGSSRSPWRRIGAGPLAVSLSLAGRSGPIPLAGSRFTGPASQRSAEHFPLRC